MYEIIMLHTVNIYNFTLKWVNKAGGGIHTQRERMLLYDNHCYNRDKVPFLEKTHRDRSVCSYNKQNELQQKIGKKREGKGLRGLRLLSREDASEQRKILWSN